jgi:hypothetical protein
MSKASSSRFAVSSFGGCAQAGLDLKINVSQRLTVVVAGDETTAVVLFDIPGRRAALPTMVSVGPAVAFAQRD